MNQVQRIISQFAAQLEQAIRQQVADEVQDRLQQLVAGKNGKRNGTGKTIVPRAAGSRRSAAEMEQTSAALLSYIAKNPGQRSELIAAGMGVGTGEIALPLKRLVAEKKLKAKGKARGTTYTAA